jgi:hypothetical protein
MYCDMKSESRDGPLLGNASLSSYLWQRLWGKCIPMKTLVTARLICVPVTTDTQITTDEYTYCCIKCSVFGSREVVKEEQFAR